MNLDDPRWEGLEAGYRVPFDPRPLLRELAKPGDHEATWEQLWTELHHQGTVGAASYASVPSIVEAELRSATPDWNAYAIVAVVDLARDGSSANEAPPSWLQPEYDNAIAVLGRRAAEVIPSATEPELVRSLLAVVALSKGHRRAARLMIEFNEDEIEGLELPDYGRIFPEHGG